MNIGLKTKKNGQNFAGNDVSEENAEASEIGILRKAPKNIAEGVINLIPAEVAEKNQVVAFERSGNLVKIAMLDPQNIDVLNLLRFIGEKEKVEFKIYIASPEIIGEMLKYYTGPTEMVREAVASFKGDTVLSETENEEKRKNREEILADAPVTKLVEVIISHAVEGRASDIHIEPMDNGYRVRFRVDGVLHVSLLLPKEIGPVVISRVKILADLKIDEKRKPQDGRFKLISGGKEIDFRVSTLPVIDGEKVALRILDKKEGVSSIEKLGMLGSARDNMELAIRETYGMILITGPTGSGKSTTLYALLKILNGEERNIITLEDPIEYNIEGLNQSQIKPEIGYTFASGLRTILRQDPNIIMVGEIRDSETAELAVHAALTGHLMFSTLHTNTAIGAIPRLIDMGIEPFLLSSALRMVVAQRLVRKICEKCKKEKKISPVTREKILEEIKNISPDELQKYKLDLNAGAKFFHGKGCDDCSGTGLKGRIAIYEVVPVVDAMKNIIEEKRGNESMLREERDRKKILTIRQDGILKALMGLTSLEEVERVTEGKIGLEEEDI